MLQDPISCASAAVIGSMNTTGTISGGVFTSKTDCGTSSQTTHIVFTRELDKLIYGIVIYVQSTVRATDIGILCPVCDDHIEWFNVVFNQKNCHAILGGP